MEFVGDAEGSKVDDKPCTTNDYQSICMTWLTKMLQCHCAFQSFLTILYKWKAALQTYSSDRNRVIMKENIEYMVLFQFS